MNVTTKGGFRSMEDYSVKRYLHALEDVKRVLEKNHLEIVEVYPTSGLSEVPKVGYREGYDIIAQKKPFLNNTKRP